MIDFSTAFKRAATIASVLILAQTSTVVFAGDEAFFCPDNATYGASTFFDDMENDVSGNWVFADDPDNIGSAIKSNPWDYGATNYWEPSQAISVPPIDMVSDSVAQKAADTAVPANNGYLHFLHSYSFEAGLQTNFDGGVVEYSTDSGTTWNDLSHLYDSGQAPDSTIAITTIYFHGAFAGDSLGRSSTRYDLRSLAGSAFRVRFRAVTGNGGLSSENWVVDDVDIYQCDYDFTGCDGVDTAVTAYTFTGIENCRGSNSLTAQTAVLVDVGASVYFESPATTLGPGFSVATGGVFIVRPAP